MIVPAVVRFRVDTGRRPGGLRFDARDALRLGIRLAVPDDPEGRIALIDRLALDAIDLQAAADRCPGTRAGTYLRDRAALLLYAHEWLLDRFDDSLWLAMQEAA